MSSQQIISLTHALDEQAPQSSAQSHVDHPVLVRRLDFAVLATASICAHLVLAALALSTGGFDQVDLLRLPLFGATTPWLAIGFWNATTGFIIMPFTRNPSTYVVPQTARALSPSPIVASTAILMCVRNELPDRGDPQTECHDGRCRCRRMWRSLPRLCLERHQPARHLVRRGPSSPHR
jgi:membrane glycosyltransferase